MASTCEQMPTPLKLYFACILTVSCSDVWDTSVFDCILLVSCLYRVGYFVSRCHATFMCEDTFVFAPRVLYLDRIRWFPDSRTGIHPEYIRIHQNTVFIENTPKSHRKRTPTRLSMVLLRDAE